MERGDGGAVQPTVFFDAHRNGDCCVSATREFWDEVLRRCSLYRYTIIKLRLTGPLLQLSKTVANEVCVTVRDVMCYQRLILHRSSNKRRTDFANILRQSLFV